MIEPATFVAWRHALASDSGRRRVSQAEAARRLGVAVSTYERYEARGCTSRVVALAMGAVAYGLPPYA